MLPSKEKHLSRAKEAAAKAAVSFIKSDMIVGLGTGSTAHLFIQFLGNRCKEENLNLKAIATSKRTEKLAKINQIPLLSPNELEKVDLTIDGADEVDREKRLIKGAGAALLREKIIASASRKLIIIVDSSKRVEELGKCLLPVEIVPFCWKVTLAQLAKINYPATLRKNKSGSPYETDNGHYIADIQFNTTRKTPEEDDRKIRQIPGVIETGFFIGLADQIIVGYEDGKVEIQ